MLVTIIICGLTVTFHAALLQLRAMPVWPCILLHAAILLHLALHELRRYKLIVTPGTVFVFIYSVVVVLPILLYGISAGTTTIGSLSPQAAIKGSLLYLVFLCAFTLIYRGSASNKGANTSLDAHLETHSGKVYFRFLLIFAVGLFFLTIYIFSRYEEFSWARMVISPLDEYSEVRQEGRNWANALMRQAVALLSISTILLTRKNLSLRTVAITLLFITIATFTSGGKAGFFWIFGSVAFVFGFVRRQNSLWFGLISAGSAVAITLVSFMWRGAFESLASALEILIEYNHIFYYTARSAAEISPDVSRFGQALQDLAIAFIPRQIWPNKPLEYGLTLRLLDYALRSVWFPSIRSFATMGLAEAWVSLGYAGGALSGIFLGLMVSWARNSLERPRNFGQVVYSIYLIISIYYALRVGFLNVWVYDLLFAFGVLLIARIIAGTATYKSSFSLRRHHLFRPTQQE